MLFSAKKSVVISFHRRDNKGRASIPSCTTASKDQRRSSMTPIEEIRPLAAWKGSEWSGNSQETTATIILRTSGCSWGRCLMCGYRNERHNTGGDQVTFLQGQLSWLIKNLSLEGVSTVKWFTSGSFFDEKEVPEIVRREIGEWCRGRKVIAETRPSFVTPGAVMPFLEALDDGSVVQPLHVAIGLETTDDSIRERSIRKGFTFAEYLTAADAASGMGVGVKTYLLMKPPYLTEKEALDDMKTSIETLPLGTGLISMNPCTVQRGCELDGLWRRREYRPPYLWSVLSVLLSVNRFIACDPVGGGSVRGPHNCGKCDKEIVHALREYYQTGDRSVLESASHVPCSCKKEWEYVLEHEHPYWMPLTR